MSILMHFAFALAVLGILFLVYDGLVNASRDWLAANDVMYPVYPWFVRLDHWIYHQETCRVQNVMYEQNRFFGARIKRVGKPITFLSN